ncbi:MAG TPA: SLC13 family permease [Anaerolineales bacterium]|nr:SLC13 family permease [Anaerolineales bacterium]
MTAAAVLSSLLFLAALAIIFTEKMHRSITAIAGAALMVAMGRLFGFYSEEAALQAIDLRTLGLLLGMMILVSMLEPTGFFQYLAVSAAQRSRGRPVRLFILLGGITSVVSMFMDNVTTVVLIAPVTILICEILGIGALPYLLAEALLSNTGGVATLVGDPPNVLIGSAANLSFGDFLTHSLPIVVVAWAGALGLLLYLFRRELWRRPRNVRALMRMTPGDALNEPAIARRLLVVLGFAILFFLFDPLLHLSPAFIAMGAAGAALVWIRPNIEATLKRIEWSVLIFFAALFVMVGGLEAAGVWEAVVSAVQMASNVPPVYFGIGLLWATAIFSAVVDNVPVTIALIPIIQGLGKTGMDIGPLWWAVAFGAGFGGNGTIIGSTANIIVTSLSERTRQPITAQLWLRRGLPIMLVTCLIASVLYYLLYRWF